MTEADMKVFAHAVTHYFQHLTRDTAEVRACYLVESDIPHSDYTGLVEFSGSFRGSIFCSAPRELVLDLLAAMRESDTSEAKLLDAMGEMTNTIAGNARRHFGSGLEISVPIALAGASPRLRAAIRQRPYAIQVHWRRRPVAVVIDLEPVS